MPISRQVRIILMAISPLFAIKIFLIGFIMLFSRLFPEWFQTVMAIATKIFFFGSVIPAQPFSAGVTYI